MNENVRRRNLKILKEKGLLKSKETLDGLSTTLDELLERKSIKTREKKNELIQRLLHLEKVMA